jgi:hypothetical protein
VGIVQVLIEILEFVGVLVALVFGLPLAVRCVRSLIALAKRAIRSASRTCGSQPAVEPPEWPPGGLGLALLVRVDEGAGVLHPAVQLRGAGERRHARIRLELVDREGTVRLTLKRAFPAEALNTELPLPSFAPPEGATLDEVLGWRWDVVLTGVRSELRWREHPRAAGGLNAEAELQAPTP